jgi:uncharacterized protein
VKVVLDTNILLSALMVRNSPPDLIYRAWSDRHFDLVCCEQILEELRDVSRRPQLRNRIRPTEVGTLTNTIRRLSLMFDRLPRVDQSPDPNDNFLLALADASGADYLVTGDKSGLLGIGQFGKSRIVTARQFVRHLHLSEE